MTTPERYVEKVAEAERALTYRLADWGVKDAEDKARAFVADLLRQGWRAWAPVTALPRDVTRPAPPPVELLSETRALLRAARPTEPEEKP